MDRTFTRAGRALNVPGTLDSRAVLTLSLGRATTASGEVRRDVRAVEVVTGKASDAARSETLGAAGDVTVGEGAPATVVTVAVAVVESTRRGKGGGSGRRRGRSGRFPPSTLARRSAAPSWTWLPSSAAHVRKPIGGIVVDHCNFVIVSNIHNFDCDRAHPDSYDHPYSYKKSSALARFLPLDSPSCPSATAC